MGHGCNYRNKETDTKAFWIEVDDPDDEFGVEMMLDDLRYEFEQLGYEVDDNSGNLIYYNGLGKIELETTYDSGGIVVRLEPAFIPDFWSEPEVTARYNLFMANHERMYNRIKRHFLNAGYNLRIATSGYTSTQITS